MQKTSHGSLQNSLLQKEAQGRAKVFCGHQEGTVPQEGASEPNVAAATSSLSFCLFSLLHVTNYDDFIIKMLPGFGNGG
jgi:hypothetical protein